MTDNLDTVLDIAKKLRKSAKKTDDPQLQGLITDLNLALADLKVELVEQRAAELAEHAHRDGAGSSENGSESREPATAHTDPLPRTY